MWNARARRARTPDHALGRPAALSPVSTPVALCAVLISCLQVLFYHSNSSLRMSLRLFKTRSSSQHTTTTTRLEETHADRELLLSSGAMYVLGGTAGGTANDGTEPPL